MANRPSRGQKKKSLKDLSRERLSAADFGSFSEEAMEGSDRACALVCSSFLENVLRDLLETCMRDNWPKLHEAIFDGVQAPLGTFASRITLAYALGLVNESTKEALTSIRRIRNVFAHSEKPQTFRHALITNEIAKLEKIDGIIPGADPRRKYVAACVLIGGRLGIEIGTRRKNHALVRALKNHERSAR